MSIYVLVAYGYYVAYKVVKGEFKKSVGPLLGANEKSILGEYYKWKSKFNIYSSTVIIIINLTEIEHMSSEHSWIGDYVMSNEELPNSKNLSKSDIESIF